LRILVTGGAGYIGSHTVKALINSGYKNIIVIDDLSSGYAKNVLKPAVLIKGDFGDENILSDVFKLKIDTVLHFAAFKSAPESVINPIKYYENNVSKSLLMLEKCLENGVKNFIFSSSAAVYGDVQSFPITEEFETKPTNPYGWSKLFFEQILSDVSAATGLKHVSLRYFNAAGADPEGLLGANHAKGDDLISRLMVESSEKGKFQIFGSDYETKDGTCIRDIVHVSDLASAHVDALRYLVKGGGSEIINLGSESGYSIREIVSITKEITGMDFDVVDAKRRPGDIVVSIASSERAKEIIGWTRNFSDLETIIQTAWNWDKKASEPGHG